MSLERDINRALDQKIDSHQKGLNAISVYRERLIAGIESRARELHDPSLFDKKRESVYALIDASVNARLDEIKKDVSDHLNREGLKISTFDLPDWVAGHVLGKQLGI